MADSDQFQSVVSFDKSALISNGQQVSQAIDMAGNTLTGLIMPSSFTGTSITFQSSVDNTTFIDMYDTAGNALSVTVAANRWVAFAPQDFAGVRYLKLKSGSAEAADRSITLVLRPV